MSIIDFGGVGSVAAIEAMALHFSDGSTSRNLLASKF